MADPRARLYGLLGRLLVDPGPADLALARALPALAPAFPADADPDALAASHHTALGLEVLPFAPVFLSADGLLTDPAREHLGAVLIASGSGDRTAHALAIAAWPPFVLALRDAGEPGWALVAELALELLASEGPAAVDPAVPGLPDLDAADTDVRSIVGALVRPARSGWFPTRRALYRVAAAAQVAAGFGDRAGMLESAVLAAVDADRAPLLLGALAAELDAWDRGYAQLRALAAPTDPWRARIAASQALVARMAAALG